jgi:PAS domain-containing protein
MVAVEGATHVVSYLNPAFARLAGKAAAELIGRPFAEAVPEGAGNGCLPLLDRLFRTGTLQQPQQPGRRGPAGGRHRGRAGVGGAVRGILHRSDLR